MVTVMVTAFLRVAGGNSCRRAEVKVVMARAPERWERWECVPSQFEILAATFG